jgi:hypothetical protein
MAIAPEGLPNAPGFERADLRLMIFRAEAANGHDATALAAIRPLLSQANPYSNQSLNADGLSAARASDDSGSAERAADGNSASPEPWEDENETLAQLELQAPLPVQGPQTDAEKAAFANMISQVYERTGALANAVSYLKLAVHLEQDRSLRKALLLHVDQLNTALAVEVQNISRRPVIQRALNQSVVVRPRLAAADLSGGVRHMEAQ